MATIKLGGNISDIRGSIGGTVYSRNRGGAYAKQRVKGTNPNTARQNVVRAIMSSMYTAWAALTATVRNNWAAYAAAVPFMNRLGDTINLTGYNMYTRTKAIFDLIGETMPAAAPTVLTLPAQDPTVAITPDVSDNNISVAFDDSAAWAAETGGHMVVYQSPPQNPTINSYDGPFTYAGKIDGAVVPVSSPAVVTSLYTMAAGQKVFCQFRIVRADGRVSNPFRCVGTAAA